MDSEVLIHFHGTKKIIVASQSDNLLNSLVQNKIPISHSCGGNGTCGTCRVIILKSGEKLEAPHEIENEMIRERHFHANERLSCQIKPVDQLEIQLP